MKKIIYIVLNPFWKRDYHRMGAEYLENTGYNVEIWRIKSGKAIDFGDDRIYNGENYFQYDFLQFKQKVKANKKSIFILQKAGDEYSLLLAREGCKYIIISGMGCLPPPFFITKTKKSCIKNKLKQYSGRSFFNNMNIILNFFRQKYLLKANEKVLEKNAPAALVTSTHYAAKQYFSSEYLKCKVYYIHSMDYDRYIETNLKDSTINEKYIVYCDSGYFGESYDYVNEGYEPQTKKYRDKYFSQLNLLFSKLENYYGLPVVILGHPHTIYNGSEYSGRKIVFDKACEYTKDAKLFLLNFSTAVSFPILYNKPLLFICSSLFKEVPLGLDSSVSTYDYIRHIAADQLKTGFVDLDRLEKYGKVHMLPKCADHTGRRKYIKKYIIDNKTDNITIAECLTEIISSL